MGDLRIEPVLAADCYDPVSYVPVPAASTPEDAVLADARAKLNAGGALVYAIFHSGHAGIERLPQSVLVAYAAACAAYGVGRSLPGQG